MGVSKSDTPFPILSDGKIMSKLATYLAELRRRIRDDFIRDSFKKATVVSVYDYNAGDGDWSLAKSCSNIQELEDYLFSREVVDPYGTIDELIDTYWDMFEEDPESEETDAIEIGDESDIAPEIFFIDLISNLQDGCYVQTIDPQVRARILHLYEALPPIHDIAMVLVAGP